MKKINATDVTYDALCELGWMLVLCGVIVMLVCPAAAYAVAKYFASIG